MLMYNKSEIANIANEYGFQRDTFEKVLRLKTVLEFIQEDTLLRDHLVLKGGTCFGFFIFCSYPVAYLTTCIAEQQGC